MAPPSPRAPTANVRLRDVVEDDLLVFFEHQRDPVACELAAFPSRGRDAFMTHWRGLLRDESLLKQTVLVDGRVAGNIVSFVQWGEREVGYWIGREHWGGGVATAALGAFLRQMTARPLHARVAAHNHASRRVLEKNGFVVSDEHGEELALVLGAVDADDTPE